MNYGIFAVDNKDLAFVKKIAMNVDSDWQKVLGTIKMDRFSDGELSPQFEVSIRDKQVFLVISTTTPEQIMKLLLAIDAAKRASAEEIIAVIPYFGYARQDRKEGRRGAIGAKLMSDLYQTAGADRIVAIDLHSEQIQGFFNIPVNMIPGHIAFKRFIHELGDDDYCIVSPDAGGVKRATKFYQKFLTKFPTATFGMLSKIRNKPNSIERMDLIADVKGRHVIMVDDMVDTGGTLTSAAKLIKEAGAISVAAVISHGVLSGVGHSRISESEYLDRLVITDSIQQKPNDKIQVVSCAKVIANAIEAIVHSYSFDHHIEKID